MSGNLAALNFNPSEMPPPRDDYELLPPGIYSAIIVRSEFRDDGTQDGKNVTVKCQVTGPEYVGRVFFENMYVCHTNEKRARIANETLQKICIAVGWSGPLRNTESLENKPFNVRLGHYTNKATNKTYIDVKSWSTYDPNKLGVTAAAPKAAPAAQFAQPAAPAPAAAQPGAPAPTAEQPPWTSDDIPF